MTTVLPLIHSDDVGAYGPRLTAGVVSDASAESLAGVFKALGAPTRVKLLSMVAAAPGAEACICDMTAPVGLSQPTVSHHMRLLVEAGLVTREQRGRWAHFRIVPGALAAVAFALQPAGSATRES